MGRERIFLNLAVEKCWFLYLGTIVCADFFSGNSLTHNTHYLLQPVEPGETVDLTVDMIAPEQVEFYRTTDVRAILMARYLELVRMAMHPLGTD